MVRQQLFLLVLTIASTLGAPTPEITPESRFSVEVAPSHSRPVQTRSSSSKIRRRGTSSLASFSALGNNQSSAGTYLSSVTIGDQEVTLQFDTGSSDLWVYSPYVHDKTLTERSLFDPNISPTWRRLDGFSWNITYEDSSSASGIVGTDVLQIGGQTMKNVIVEVATKVSNQFSSDKTYSGLLGLAWPRLSTIRPARQESFFFQFIDSLERPLFTVDINHDQTGAFEFGYIDEAKYTGEIQYTPVMNNLGSWRFMSAGYKIGEKFYPLSHAAIADTGTTALVMNRETVDAYYGSVPGSFWSDTERTYHYPCNSTLQPFALELGNGNFVAIPPADMNYGTLADDNSMCVGMLAAMPDDEEDLGDSYTFGSPLFNNQFVVFDAGKVRLGFAGKAAGDKNAVDQADLNPVNRTLSNSGSGGDGN
jgi:hypothetical protein